MLLKSPSSAIIAGMENKYIVGIGGFILLIVLMALLVFQSNKTPSIEGNPLDFNLNNTPVPTAAPQITQLQAQEIKVGTSAAEVAAGDTIVVHYAGSFVDGKKFDSSYDRNEPFQVTIGVGQVIAGFDLGVVGMKVGGKRKLFIPANLAYGERGVGPIPPNTPLIFEIELLEIKPKETPTPSPQTTVSLSPSPQP